MSKEKEIRRKMNKVLSDEEYDLLERVIHDCGRFGLFINTLERKLLQAGCMDSKNVRTMVGILSEQTLCIRRALECLNDGEDFDKKIFQETRRDNRRV